MVELNSPLAGVAVVTGGCQGLGESVADSLVARGFQVARVSRNADRFTADVSDPEQVARVASQIVDELGPPIVLVNAAGQFGPLERFRDTDPAAWLETLRVDTFGPYLMCRTFIGGMLDAGWGRIINVSSAASFGSPGPLGSAYVTAKVALNQLTRHLAADLNGTGVTANAIHPGDVRTAMWASIRDETARLGSVAEPFRRWVEWVDKTGGDPPSKAVDLVLAILESEINGRFIWVRDPLQSPVKTWGEGPELQL